MDKFGDVCSGVVCRQIRNFSPLKRFFAKLSALCTFSYLRSEYQRVTQCRQPQKLSTLPSARVCNGWIICRLCRKIKSVTGGRHSVWSNSIFARPMPAHRPVCTEEHKRADRCRSVQRAIARIVYADGSADGSVDSFRGYLHCVTH